MKKLFRAFAFIFKLIGKLFSFIRSTVANLLFLLVIGVIIFSLFQSKEVIIEDDSILKLSITGSIVEQKSDVDPFSDIINDVLGFSSPTSETLLQDILDAISQAEDDPQISGILLDLSTMGSAAMNQLESIGTALKQFRLSGKPVIAAEDYYNQNQYYLASFADQIFLNPMGGIYLSGFGTYRLYFREAIEKLKINYHVFKVGSFKSAHEPLTRNSMSSDDRYQTRTWLTSLWKNYVQDVAGQRDLAPEVILDYINNVPENLKSVEGNLAQLALQSGLINEIKTRHETKTYLASISSHDTEHGYTHVSLNQYLKKVHRSYQYEGSEKDTVALIVAQGTIIPGQTKPGGIGAETLSSLIRTAAASPAIKAVVLRVDSGGGSAFASELIRQEILQLKKTGKPLVVSMGAVAASGAYWISADADKIIASTNTLTGSIGIFMAIPTFENSLNSLGIYRDGVGTTNLSGALDLRSPLSSEIKSAIQLTLDNGYKTFLSVVSEGRNIAIEDVEEIAKGRVFSGNAALESGLVDQIGSLSDSIRAAADLAGLVNYRTTTLDSPGSFRHRLSSWLGVNTLLSRIVPSSFNSVVNNFVKDTRELQSLLLFKDPNGMYAHCMINYY